MPRLSEEDRYALQLVRIRGIIVGLGIVGTVLVSLYYGWQTGLGFLIGATVSYSSLSRWHRVVESIGGGSPRPRMPVVSSIVQFGLLAIAAYVMVKYLQVNRLAAFSGLLVGAAAVIMVMLYELVYGA
ncbi:MAG TPA: hypothetical protein VEV17_18900 [Bryobacteraceae bacterium]|nr:hypothetical protein [Bryobacteraceae bacterium]